ncbi:MAG: glycoside hydrolase family 38 C-terminal domain-containing protein [Chloroflexota bacterium]|nr:glycoside hydrolase family 38 C-terminal domain-containing protein [Chloroflexota bacterium]
MALTSEWRHRIMAWRHELSQHLYQPIGAMGLEAAFTMAQFSLAEALAALSFEPVQPGAAWGAKWEYGWFRGELTVPDAAAGQMIALMPDVGREQQFIVEIVDDKMTQLVTDSVAEAVVYINGEYAGAVDNKHKVIYLTDSAEPGETFSVVLEAYAGHGPREWHAGPTPPERETVPEPPAQQCVVGQNHFGIWNELAYQLMMDVETLWDLREHIDPESLRLMEIDEGLKDFSLIVDYEAPLETRLASMAQARQRLQPLLEKHNGDTTPEMIGFGHAHIDVAWLWPLAETERKCVRTFGTQLSLMERYPEYKFLQSQPHLYRMVKIYYPDLYERILAAIERGQWIPDGASWVEPDTNISSGESLIRQLIHGKRFYMQEFGVDSRLLWLPDVFGYSGALPQIMRGCEVEYFSTHKILWAYNGGEQFPYNTFIWEGIDGSEVKAHFHNDYNSETNPSKVINRWRERVQKDGFSMRLYPFGWGDGGGGPTREHLEYIRREGDLEGVPKFRMASPMAFFEAQDEQGWPEARYVGELYFQAHRGTYTSQARTKALNRRSEFALREAEIWGAAAQIMAGFDFPYEAWDEAWKTVMLNQFHDILPGSSIHRVYEEAEAQLAEVVAEGQGIAADAQAALDREEEGLTVFNSLSWDRKALLELPEGWEGVTDADGKSVPVQQSGEGTIAEVTVPSCGWAGFRAGDPEIPENTIEIRDKLLENHLMKVEFNEFGEITSIFDKINQEELAIGLCNSMKMYQDIPSAFDAWDIDSMYRQTPVELKGEASIEVTAEGPLFGQLVIKRKLHDSEMTQTVTLGRDTRRMEFHTVIDWQERHKLLKVNFPVDYHVQEALHEIQFGHIARPTHRSRQIDRDRFEVSNQKWTALVEPERGFAILNDSKYGVDVLEKGINLTLLKSALAPDMTADLGRQEFTYAMTFWDTPFIDSDLVQQGYELNVPVGQVSGQSKEDRSLFRVDASNVILETVKPAEMPGAGDVVLRLYEAVGTYTKTTLSTSLPFQFAYRTNMLEKPLEELAFDEKRLALEFHPFEIKTLRLRVKEPLTVAD